MNIIGNARKLGVTMNLLRNLGKLVFDLFFEYFIISLLSDVRKKPCFLIGADEAA